MSLVAVERKDAGPVAVVFNEIRQVSAAELQDIETAISFCRAYASRYTVQLVSGARAMFDQAIGQLRQPLPGTTMKTASDQVEIALVTFLLMWRLFLDQARSDLSQRFGDGSTQLQDFKSATNKAYDERPGYRLVEGLRNYVQHVGMPGLTCWVSQGNGESELMVTLPREKLLAALENRGGQRRLRDDLRAGTGPLPIVDLVSDAMRGFEDLVAVLAAIDLPELSAHLALLKRLVAETAPHAPVLADLNGMTDGGGNLKMTRFDDLEYLLVESQNPNNP